MRILILVGVAVVAFTIIFIPGYFLIVPRPDAKLQELNMQSNLMTPANPGEFQAPSLAEPPAILGTPSSSAQ